MSWRVTLPCTRGEALAIAADGEQAFDDRDSPPVLVAEEPDEKAPETWRLRAYFEQEPDAADLERLARLAAGDPVVERLEDEDWVGMSQAGMAPIRAGRFHVHTPGHPADSQAIDFVVDAGLAFGTGHHATTSGCLGALDRLEREGFAPSNIADIGTGTGLLAFAAHRLWPRARIVASDIDPVAIDVAEQNAAANNIPVGEGSGHVLLLSAAGLGHSMIARLKPFDLIVANILAGPLIDLAPGLAGALADGGRLILSGLLDRQAERVADAYRALGLSLRDAGSGEWRVLELEKSA